MLKALSCPVSISVAQVVCIKFRYHFSNKFVKTIKEICKESTSDHTEATVCTSDPVQVWRQS